jgi:hypothetical protein
MDIPSFRVGYRHGRADSVAVAAVHAEVLDDFDRLLAVNHLRPDGRLRAEATVVGISHMLPSLSWSIVGEVLWMPVCYVRAVDGAAHVQAAGYRYPEGAPGSVMGVK